MRLVQSKPVILLLGLLLTLVVSKATLAESLSESAHVLPVVLSSGDCTTVVSPGQSIQAAVNAAAAGHKICVRAGVYKEAIKIKPAKRGISLVAFPGERPIVDGEGRLPGGGAFAGLIQIAAHDTVLSGFEVRGSTARGVMIDGDTHAQGIRNVVVRDMVIRGNWNNGLTVRGDLALPARNVTIESNVLYDNSRKNASGSGSGSAVTLVSAADSRVAGNRIYNNFGLGLVIDWYTTNVVVEDNVIYDNKASNLYLNRTQNPIVRRNLVYCTANPAFWSEGLALRDEDVRAGMPLAPASSGQIVVNNIVSGCKVNFTVSSQITSGSGRGGLRDAVVANNTFIHARTPTMDGAVNVKLDARALYQNSRFINNLLVQSEARNMAAVFNTPTDFSTFVVANNLYSIAPLAGWFPGEAGRVIGNPLLVDASAPAQGAALDPGNYRLRTGSPAINVAQASPHVTEDYFRQQRQAPPDIGAHEFKP